MSNARSIEFANVSDPGRKRPHNEDSAVTDIGLGLALVADGMGGYKAGEVASAIAAKVVLDGVRAGIDQHRFVRKHVDGDRSKESLLMQDSILEANHHIFRTARDVPQCQGMGTTIVAILFTADKVVVAHVGDSRVYRFRNGELVQLTSDHSLIQELIDRGFFTPEEAHANTPKNLVTRALGIDDNVVVDVQELDILPEDIYLLCSDGLNDMVDDEEIRLTLSKYSANLVQAANELVRLANESGGKDNISVVLARPLKQGAAGSGILAKLMRLLTRSS
ncbi:MAG: Stp1/IreP family PP2C-type Ser/Thr phosphatase [Gammaproteobacteria bacterium]|nr:Stp1/IreP family PP2C-type Ser/Thr phosphatase [Gammaproteobacteria bacterium]MBI5615374.1 Stp1/IreP family PP2C-type Ser/Thr phosphatase [Gammaproteobacteria bacterium]